MILFYDTETSGLPNFREPSDGPDQPHLLQLAMLLHDTDGTEIDRFTSIVRPGVHRCVIAPEAFDAHGITLERAMDEGCEPLVALDAFMAFVERSSLRVGHNESFDRRIVRIHSARHRGIKWEAEAPSFCTMWKSKFIINLPATEKMIAAGMPGPKQPKLEEAYQFFFGEPLVGAHDALVDITATARVFYHLVREVGVPMFKPEGASSSRAAPRRTYPPRKPAGDPFAAAASLLGGMK